MSDWYPVLLNGLAVLGGILLTHSLFLYSQFYRESQGYMWRAARKVCSFLFMFSIVEWVVGIFFFYLSRYVLSYLSLPIPDPLWAGIVGIIVAAIPTTLEGILLPETGVTVKNLQKRLTRLLLKLNILLRYNFAWAIEYCREQDVYDCQQPDGWGLGINPSLVGRRIRMLYEFSKYKIAEERRDPSLLVYDVGRVPWGQFYLVVRHVGRKKLREYIKNPIKYVRDWDGSERRRATGTIADRDPSMGTPSRQSRRPDDPNLIEQIRRGRLGGSVPIPLLPEENEEG